DAGSASRLSRADPGALRPDGHPGAHPAYRPDRWRQWQPKADHCRVGPRDAISGALCPRMPVMLARWKLALAFAGGVRIGATASRPSPVLPDGMNQPDQHVNVDVIEPAGREAHHVLFFASARMAARPGGEAEEPIPLLPAATHDPLRGGR